MAGKNNGRFLKKKLRKSFILSIPTTSNTITTAENKYGGLCARRHDAAIGSCGAGFVCIVIWHCT
jgi:hypothetical protein